MNKEQKELLEQELKNIGWRRVMPVTLILAGFFFCIGIITAIIGAPLAVGGVIWNHSITKRKNELEYLLAGTK